MSFVYRELMGTAAIIYIILDFGFLPHGHTTGPVAMQFELTYAELMDVASSWDRQIADLPA